MERSDEYKRWRTCRVARPRTPRSCTGIISKTGGMRLAVGCGVLFLCEKMLRPYHLKKANKHANRTIRQENNNNITRKPCRIKRSSQGGESRAQILPRMLSNARAMKVAIETILSAVSVWVKGSHKKSALAIAATTPHTKRQNKATINLFSGPFER